MSAQTKKRRYPMWRSPLFVADRQSKCITHAQEKSEQGAASSSAEEEDSLLEALEASIKSRKGTKAAQSEALRPTPRPATAKPTNDGTKANWPEGQLFPDGWEEMNPFEKVTQLYMGERGLLFWANKAALASIVGLIVAWALFRFAGPLLGMYQLENDITSQPNL